RHVFRAQSQRGRRWSAQGGRPVTAGRGGWSGGEKASMEGPVAAARARFRRLAWLTLGYTVLVILFGAVVRITGSGAGCGQHWPTWHGEVVPGSPTIERMIEFSRRVTSGRCGVSVLALVIAAVRWFPRGHTARVGAWLALVFTITEALIGA